MALEGLTECVRATLSAGLPGVSVHNVRLPIDHPATAFPAVVFQIRETTARAFFGGSEEDHFAALMIACFDLADRGSAALRTLEQAAYDLIDRKSLVAAGYAGVQGACRRRGDTDWIEPNLYGCISDYVVFGSKVIT